MANMIYGTPGADTINGTNADDEIYAGDGNDRINGSPGSDHLFGGNGDDLFQMEGMGDTLASGLIDGGAGYDIVEVSYATLQWDDFNRQLLFGHQFYSVERVEEIHFGDDADTGGDWGTSTIDSDLTVFLGGGDDIVSLSGAINVFGEAGNDFFDLYAISTGQEFVTNGGVDGGSGTDTIYVAPRFTVDLTRGFASHANSFYTLTSIENVYGLASSDPANTSRILGNDSDNHIAPYHDSTTAEGMGVFYSGRGGNDEIRGSKGHDRLYGDAGNDALFGKTGDDRLLGGDGDDVVEGGDGADRLIGGAGADILRGGAGNDVYFLDDAGDSGDSITELVSEGRDVVWAGFNYSLGANVENLQLLAGDWHGTGNALDNRITAGEGLNILSGLDGDDILSSGDHRDLLDGGNGDDRLQGGTGRDDLDGGAGNDRLFGGSGHDRLTGGEGRDRFIFENAETLAGAVEDTDRIADFDRSEGDRINLSLIDANVNTAENDVFTFIGTGAFSGTAGELRYSFDAGRTVIEMDRDGDGLGDLFLRLEGEIDVAARDFYF